VRAARNDPGGVGSIPRGKRRLIVASLALLAGAAAFASLGRLLVSEDPLQPADIIYVLGGGWINRTLEAVHLSRDGYASHIVLSPDRRLEGAIELEREGVHFPTDAEMARQVLVEQLKFPASSVELLAGSVDNTAQEAELIRPRARAAGWSRIIIITECPATRRARFAFRRALGADVKVISRCSRFDAYEASRWWMSRWGIRETMYETPKLFAYWLGLAG